MTILLILYATIAAAKKALEKKIAAEKKAEEERVAKERKAEEERIAAKEKADAKKLAKELEEKRLKELEVATHLWVSGS